MVPCSSPCVSILEGHNEGPTWAQDVSCDNEAQWHHGSGQDCNTLGVARRIGSLSQAIQKEQSHVAVICRNATMLTVADQPSGWASWTRRHGKQDSGSDSSSQRQFQEVDGTWPLGGSDTVGSQRDGRMW